MGDGQTNEQTNEQAERTLKLNAQISTGHRAMLVWSELRDELDLMKRDTLTKMLYRFRSDIPAADLYQDIAALAALENLSANFQQRIKRGEIAGNQLNDSN